MMKIAVVLVLVDVTAPFDLAETHCTGICRGKVSMAHRGNTTITTVSSANTRGISHCRWHLVWPCSASEWTDQSPAKIFPSAPASWVFRGLAGSNWQATGSNWSVKLAGDRVQLVSPVASCAGPKQSSQVPCCSVKLAAQATGVMYSPSTSKMRLKLYLWQI